MPTYEYLCNREDCAFRWEAEQSIRDESIRTCPQCKEDSAQRQISATNFVLAGGGWAREGYASK